jgi:hypothetical protein
MTARSGRKAGQRRGAAPVPGPTPDDNPSGQQRPACARRTRPGGANRRRELPSGPRSRPDRGPQGRGRGDCGTHLSPAPGNRNYGKSHDVSSDKGTEPPGPAAPGQGAGRCPIPPCRSPLEPAGDGTLEGRWHADEIPHVDDRPGAVPGAPGPLAACGRRRRGVGRPDGGRAARYVHHRTAGPGAGPTLRATARGDQPARVAGNDRQRSADRTPVEAAAAAGRSARRGRRLSAGAPGCNE